MYPVAELFPMMAVSTKWKYTSYQIQRRNLKSLIQIGLKRTEHRQYQKRGTEDKIPEDGPRQEDTLTFGMIPTATTRKRLTKTCQIQMIRLPLFLQLQTKGQTHEK